MYTFTIRLKEKRTVLANELHINIRYSVMSGVSVYVVPSICDFVIEEQFGIIFDDDTCCIVSVVP